MNFSTPETTRLKRSISLPLLIFFGIGTMVGGGFYALVGKVAGIAGVYAPLSILVAGRPPTKYLNTPNRSAKRQSIQLKR